jgi:hypothetical protein
MNEQDKQFFQSIINRVAYSDITLEEWILKYVYVKGNQKYSFEGFAYWKDIVRKIQNHPYIVFLKAAQIGYSTLALSRLFWKILRTSYKAGIYFPDDTAMKDFAQERVNPFIYNCPIVKQELVESSLDNVRIKQFGDAFLALRGTWKKGSVKSIDLDIVMLDEVDEHNKENIEFVGDRLLASKLNWMMLGSQPSMHKEGIHAEFLNTDQHFWFIKCGKCNHWNDLVANIQSDQDSIWGFKDETVFYKCLKCGGKLNNQKGEYVPKTKADKRGFQVSQLFTQLDPKIIYRKLKDANTSHKRKNFWISYIGLPYETDEERPITLEVIERNQGDHGLKEGSDYFTYHGADQGDIVHAVFGEPAENGKIRIIGLYKGHILEEQRYVSTLQKFNVFKGNIDAMPNRNWSLRMALKFQGILKLQFFSKRFSENEEYLPGEESVEVMKINRDESLQDTVDAIKNGLFLFPNPNMLTGNDLSLYEEFKHHLSMLVKEYKEDENGKPLWGFKRKVENHFGMALNSMRLAIQGGSDIVTGVVY